MKDEYYCGNCYKKIDINNQVKQGIIKFLKELFLGRTIEDIWVIFRISITLNPTANLNNIYDLLKKQLEGEE